MNKVDNADWVTDIVNDVIGDVPPKPVQVVVEELIPNEPEKEETLEELTKNWSMMKSEADKSREERIWTILGKDESNPFTKMEDMVVYVLNGTITAAYIQPYIEWFWSLSHEEAFELTWNLDYKSNAYPMVAQKHGVDVFFSRLEFWKRVLDTAKKSKKEHSKFSRDELVELANKKLHDAYGDVTYSQSRKEKAELHSKEKAVRSRL